MTRSNDNYTSFNNLIPSFEAFVAVHNKYPINAFTIYLIFRDLKIKNELSNIRILDIFQNFGISEYVIVGENSESVTRIIYPVRLEDNVNLSVLHTLSSGFEELYLCIHSADTMIYQSVSCSLPR